MQRPEHLDIIFDAASDFAQSGSVAVRIRGECMAPTLADGERVEVRRARLLLPGDIVVFRNSSSLVAHRMIGWAPIGREIGYVTQGDHCDRHDGVVTAKNVIGRVDGQVDVGQRISSFLTFVRIVLRKVAGRR